MTDYTITLSAAEDKALSYAALQEALTEIADLKARVSQL
jgi:hypothetical protein